MLRYMVCCTVLLGMSVFSQAEEKQIHPNLSFETGMEGWVLSPKKSAVTFQDFPGGSGKSALVTADSFNSGLETKPLVFGETLARDKQYRITARLLSRGLHKGSFAFSVCYNNELGHRLKQHGAWSTTSLVKSTEWISKSIVIGANTPYPFPENGHHAVIRFSFYSNDGKPMGSVGIDDVKIQVVDGKIDEGWPASISVDCGDIDTRIESRSFWTIYRIDYKGINICKDVFGSHYGTVTAYPGIKGFFGSGHTENADENVLKKRILLDGVEVEKPGIKLQGKTMVLEKSAILNKIVRVDSRTTVTGKWIDEEVTLRAGEDTRMSLVYNFMHPWLVTMTEYMAELTDGTMVSEQFAGDGKSKLLKPVSWSAVYCRDTKLGAVTVVLNVPENRSWYTQYWDQPTSYKKHYMVSFRNETMPGEQDFYYKVRVIPFEAQPDAWESAARRIAAMSRLEK